MQSNREIVQRWVDASNRQDVNALLDLSAPDIEVVGPRGSARGHQILRDWLARAGLVLQTQREFARGDAIVLQQHGVWRSPASGEVLGEAHLASSFRVSGGRVVRYARHDDFFVALQDVWISTSDGASG